MAGAQTQLEQSQLAAGDARQQFQRPLHADPKLMPDPALALLAQLWGVSVEQMQVAEARRNLPRLMQAVVRGDRVVVIRNAQKPGERGVVVMSEDRAIGASGRGGMNLAQLVASFKDRPVRLRPLQIEEGTAGDIEELSLAPAKDRR